MSCRRFVMNVIHHCVPCENERSGRVASCSATSTTMANTTSTPQRHEHSHNADDFLVTYFLSNSRACVIDSYGRIGSIVLKLPWKALMSQPVVAEVDDVLIVLTTASEDAKKNKVRARVTSLSIIDSSHSLQKIDADELQRIAEKTLLAALDQGTLAAFFRPARLTLTAESLRDARSAAAKAGKEGGEGYTARLSTSTCCCPRSLIVLV